MTSLRERAVKFWSELGPRYLPFADAATPDLPLSRLLRLSLFQVTVGMALALADRNLEQGHDRRAGRAGLAGRHHDFAASAVRAVPRADRLPLGHAPVRARLEARALHVSRHHGPVRRPRDDAVRAPGSRSAGRGGHAPLWIGYIGAGVAFLLVGAGLHTVQTVGLALATDLAPVESQPKVVGLMYVMLLLGMIVSALGFGVVPRRLHAGPSRPGHPGRRGRDDRPERNLALEAGDAGHSARRTPRQRPPSFAESWESFTAGRPRHPSPRRGRPRHDGVQHGGRSARALRRADPASGGRRHDQADRGARGRRAVRVRARVARAQPRRRPVPHGEFRRAGRPAGVRSGDRVGPADVASGCSVWARC